MKTFCAGALVLALGLAGCSSGEAGKQGPARFARKVEVAPHVRLWIACSGSGPVVVGDGGLGIPTQAWDAVRRDVRHVRFCAFDRAGIGRSTARSCRCGSLERNVEDLHALIRTAHLRGPVILVGHSTGGLDALLYARHYRPEVSGLVLVDSPSESAPVPPNALADGNTRLDFAAGLHTLRRAGHLGHLPIIVLSHGERTFSTAAAERSWTTMQKELAADSADAVRVIALDSRHLIQVDQPELVATAVEEMAAVARSGHRLRCVASFAAAQGRCIT